MHNFFPLAYMRYATDKNLHITLISCELTVFERERLNKPLFFITDTPFTEDLISSTLLMQASKEFRITHLSGVITRESWNYKKLADTQTVISFSISTQGYPTFMTKKQILFSMLCNQYNETKR
jgi:hypothetical protein